MQIGSLFTRFILSIALVAPAARAQQDLGELRVSVTDATGLALPSLLTLVSDSSQTRRETKTNDAGAYYFEHLPFGVYRIAAEHPGFIPYSGTIEIRTAVPRDIHIELSIKTASTEIVVSTSETLLDPHRTGVTYAVGQQQIREQQSSVPGRGLLGLVNSQPGWIFESNGVLHPRGSEYQTLFVVDGVPMDENRSPAFAPDLETGEVSGMSVLTGNFPAEYGRKLGGVVDITTARDQRPGFHGAGEFGGGSFGTETGFVSGTYGWNGGALMLNASGEHTNRYLDSPVLGNYTNAGRSEAISAAWDEDLGGSDRLHLTFHRRQTAFQVPNENLQEAVGQLQNRNAPEDLGQASWAHVFSSDTLLNVRGVVEDLSTNLRSNALATPIIVAQQRGFRRSYLNAGVSVQKHRHDIKFGGDAIYAPVTEALQYRITGTSFFDGRTPLTFDFFDYRLDRERALWAQDAMRFGNFTVSTGLRWDHYSLVVHQHAFSPRLGFAYYVRPTGTVFRFSYDRVFQTPAAENLLLSSSPQVDQLHSQVLRIAVQPSRGNYLETGFSQNIFSKARLDVSFYRRSFVNFADDDVFLNTGISFPITFSSAQLRGVDVKAGTSEVGPFLRLCQLFELDRRRAAAGGRRTVSGRGSRRARRKGQLSRYTGSAQHGTSASALPGSATPVDCREG